MLRKLKNIRPQIYFSLEQRLQERSEKIFSNQQLVVVWDTKVVVGAMVQPEVVVPMVKVEVEPVVKVAELPLLVGTAQKST